ALLPALQGDELIGLGDPPSRQFPVLVNQEQDAPLLEDGARLVLLAVVQPLTRQHDFLVRLGGACEATQREQAPRSSHGLHQVPPLELLGHRTPPFRMRKRQPQARYGNNHRRKRTPRLPLPVERKAVTRVQRGCRWSAFQNRVAAERPRSPAGPPATAWCRAKPEWRPGQVQRLDTHEGFRWR